MFDAMLAELRAESKRPRARVLRVQGAGKCFLSGHERAGRNSAGIRREARRLIEVKRCRRTSPLSVAEVQHP